MNTKATAAPVVTHSSQIKDLPWVGVHSADSQLFQAVDAYVRLESTPVDEKRAALNEMSIHGMDMDEPISDADFDAYLNDV